MAPLRHWIFSIPARVKATFIFLPSLRVEITSDVNLTGGPDCRSETISMRAELS